ncbi:MAG: OmpA family protein [Pseudomonadota bacterium]|nr:OmpA family protein [Pseudomonadota bacterium]
MTHGRRILALVSSGMLMAGMTGCYPRYQEWGAGTPVRPAVWSSHIVETTERNLRETGAQVVRLGDTTRIIMPVDRLFKINSTELRPCGLAMLDYMGQLVSYCSYSNIDITAHSDNVFNDKRREQLTAEQANVIASHLWAQGVARGRMHFWGCADRDQIATDRTVFGSADNRRIEVTIR